VKVRGKKNTQKRIEKKSRGEKRSPKGESERCTAGETGGTGEKPDRQDKAGVGV